MKALTILNDRETTDAVLFLLRKAWPDTIVTQYPDIEQGMKFIEANNPGLVIVDLRDKLNWINAIRKFTAAPVMVIVDKSNKLDGIKALERGVDEFICKPLNSNDFLARTNALLRITYGNDFSSLNLLKTPQIYPWYFYPNVHGETRQFLNN